MQKPFYNPNKSYEENYQKGPFGGLQGLDKPQYELFGHKLFLPFGIPAGPLVNSNFVAAAFKKNFDVCVYKTVRTREYPCHPKPNVLAVHVKNLSTNRKSPLIADSNYTQPLSITNSFGVPSTNPKIWQEDMTRALGTAGHGQVMIGSFQGTSDGSGLVSQYIDDFVLVAQLVKETGTPILEANLSCPNEGTAHLLCFDTGRTALIAKKIKLAIGKNTPLILKLAYFEKDTNGGDTKLEEFVKTVGKYVDGFSAINTIPATIVNKKKQQALPGEGRARSGVCGSAITWAGLDMVSRLQKIRLKLKMDFTIVGVGGVTNPKEFRRYQKQGADIVMSATGAMWNTNLANEIWEERQKNEK